MSTPPRIDIRKIIARLHAGDAQRPTGQTAVAAQAGLLVVYLLAAALLFLPGPQRELLGEVAGLVPVEIYFFGCVGALVYVFSTLRTLVAAEGVSGSTEDDRSTESADADDQSAGAAPGYALPWLPANARVSAQTLNLFTYLSFYLVTGTLLAAGSYLVFTALYGDVGAAATDPEAFPLALAFLTGLFIDPILRVLERTVNRVAGDVDPDKRNLIVATTEAEVYRTALADATGRLEGEKK
jgi:hypothetical protein